MKILKYLLLSCLFLITNDALSAAAAAAPVANVLSKVELEVIKLGDIKAIKSIVEKKGLNVTDQQNNPILCIVLDMESISDADNKILKAKLDAARWLIVEQKANIECRNDCGLTPFLMAVNKFIPCFSPFVVDRPAMSYEFNQLRFDFIEFLIGRNVDLNATDSEHYENEDNVIASGGDRRNFLMMAIENGDTELVERLCSLGVITQAMYEAAIEVYQKNQASAQAARPSWLDTVSLPANAQAIVVNVKDPNAESAAGADAGNAGAGAAAGVDGAEWPVNAAMAAGDANQKKAQEVLDPKQQVIAVMTTYFSYRNGLEVFARVGQNMAGSDGARVAPLIALVASYVINPMKKNVNATATSEA